MSIQGSFNSMLSSLVFATGQVRQARAQERTAKALEGKDAEKLELAKARLAVSQQNADTAAAHEASLAPQREAKASKTRAEGYYIRSQGKLMRAEAKRIEGADKDIASSRQTKATSEQKVQDYYLTRANEIDNSRAAVNNLKEAIRGEKENG